MLQGLRRRSQGVEEFLELPVGPVLEGVGEAVPVLGQLQQGGEEGRPMDLGLWRVILELLQGLWRGSQGVEEFLELPVGHVLGGIGEVASVLGLLQQGVKRVAPWTWGCGG